MDHTTPRMLNRRRLLGGTLLAVVAVVLAACRREGRVTTAAPDSTAASEATGTTGAGVGTDATGATSPTTDASAPATTAATLAATPACPDDDEPTPAQTEGPYFTPGSPERTDLRAGRVVGTALNLSGRVLTTSCAPVGRALVDVWQADGDGEYDNQGYHLRGHQFTDEEGRWQLATVVPGLYPGRTRHIHVKVQGPGRPVLTTQLYFPGEPRNAADRIYRPECEIDMVDAGAAAGGRTGTFTFVLDA